MPKKVSYTVNKAMPGFKAGSVVTVEVDANGVPVDQFWRRRVRDAKIDNCISLKEEGKQSSKSAPKEA